MRGSINRAWNGTVRRRQGIKGAYEASMGIPERRRPTSGDFREFRYLDRRRSLSLSLSGFIAAPIDEIFVTALRDR